MDLKWRMDERNAENKGRCLMNKTEHPVLVKAREMAEKIKTLEEVERFQLAEQQLNESESVHTLIQTIKQKQKELVHAKHYQKSEYVRQVEKELDELQYEFDHLPIVKEYQQMQVEVNDLLQIVQRTLFEKLEKKIAVESGGAMAKGCGNTGVCG